MKCVWNVLLVGVLAGKISIADCTWYAKAICMFFKFVNIFSHWFKIGQPKILTVYLSGRHFKADTAHFEQFVCLVYV